MKTKKVDKRSLIMSAMALLICVSMLIGSTMAWFTDSVTSSGNVIKSGTLEIDLMLKTKGDTDYVSVTETSDKKAFNYELWEPGYTEWVNAKVVNKGTLALKYTMRIVPSGTVSILADVIDVYYSPTEIPLPGSRPEDLANSGLVKLCTLREAITNESFYINDNLLAGGEDFATLALHMREEAGNEYQGLSIGSDFALQILATQYTHEEDSFDNQYDAQAEYDFVANDSDQLSAAIAAASNSSSEEPITIGLGADFTYTETPLAATGDANVTIDLNGHNLTITNDTSDGLVVENGATMTLTNSSNEGKYVFNTTNDHTDAIYVHSSDDQTATLNIENVEVEIDASQWISIHAEGDASGTAVININDGTVLTVKGADNQIAAVQADGGSIVNMNGGVINVDVSGSDPNAEKDAVGVLIMNWVDSAHTAQFNMNGGEINVLSPGGQAVQTGEGYTAGVIRMIGGKINVEAENAAAIGVYKDADIEVTGGEINLNGQNDLGFSFYPDYQDTSYGIARVKSGIVRLNGTNSQLTDCAQRVNEY